MKLQIDRREDESVVDEVVRVCEELDVEYETDVTLESGDYVYGDIGIERKDLDDLGNSLATKNPKLVDQTDEIAENFDRGFVFVVGDRTKFQRYQRGKVGFADVYRKIKEHLPKIIGVQNVPVIHLRSDPMFADVLVRTMVLLEDQDVTEMVMLNPSTVSDSRMSMIMGISQIGKKDTKKVFEHFDSFADMATASPDEYLDIDGMGFRKAKRLYMVINSEFDDSGFDWEEAEDERWQQLEDWVDTDGVGDEVMIDIYKATNGLEGDIEKYVKEELDLGQHRQSKVMEKLY